MTFVYPDRIQHSLTMFRNKIDNYFILVKVINYKLFNNSSFYPTFFCHIKIF